MNAEPGAAREDAGPFRLYDRWPAIHLAIALAVLSLAAAHRAWLAAHPSWLWFAVVAIPVLAAHEWEEFGFPGGFRRWFNVEVCRSSNPDGPLTKKQAALNHMPLMLVFPFLALVGTRWPWLGMVALFSLVADGVFHIAATSLTRRYSPGTITAAALYLPAGAAAAYVFTSSGRLSPAGVLTAAFSGVLVLGIFLFLPILLGPHGRGNRTAARSAAASPGSGPGR
jgi:hypothetical protein